MSKPEPSIDWGTLRKTAWRKWEIVDEHKRRLAELSSGDVVFVDVAGKMKLTRIEYDHSVKDYVSIDGYRLAEGIEAALPNA
jgi:hypothetical protein